MRRRALLAAIAALWLAPAHAQEGRIGLPPPVLTIDQDRLFAETDFGLALQARIESEARALAAENRRIEAELAEEERALTGERPELENDAFRELADAFDEKVQRIRAEQEAKAEALAQVRESGQERFLSQLAPILSEILRERGALILLDRRNVVLSADAIDITDDAIGRVNERLPPETDGTAASPAETTDRDTP